MGIETRALPYEILVRFSEGAEHQVGKPGEFEGAHYIERKRLVDNETGEIVGTPKGEETDKAVALPKEKAVAFFGEQFAAFEGAQRTLREAYDALKAERDMLQQQLAQLNEQSEARIAALESARSAADQRLAAVQQALA